MHIDDSITHYDGERFRIGAVYLLAKKGINKWRDAEKALKDGRLRKIKGIGKKTIAAIEVNVSVCRMKENGEI